MPPSRQDVPHRFAERARPASDGRADKRRANGQRDLWVVAAATLASYLVATSLELHEVLSTGFQRFERWQADEILLVLLVCTGGLGWYAGRRRRDSQAELALRELAEARVGDLLARNRQLAQRLIALQENERRTLARELHDEFGQSCAALRAETAYLRHCAAAHGETLLASAQRADAAAQSLYLLVRDLLRRLRPADLDTLGLGGAVQALCESWQARTGIVCTFTDEAGLDALGDPLDITVYRVAQEALTNVARHACARWATVKLSLADNGDICLTVEDDGRGLPAGGVPTGADAGFGLLGASERAAAVGGRLRIDGPPGAGVRLALRMPSHGGAPDDRQRDAPAPRITPGEAP